MIHEMSPNLETKDEKEERIKEWRDMLKRVLDSQEVLRRHGINSAALAKLLEREINVLTQQLEIAKEKDWR